MPGWIDVHGHYYPPASDIVHEKKWQAMRDGLFMVPKSATKWDAEETIAYLDKAGIQMQMLSNIPTTIDDLRSSNDFGASMVRKYPSRFGFLAALPTDDCDAALAEIKRGTEDLRCDGFAVTCCYKGEVWLSDSRLDPVWAELDRRRAVVFTHPNAYAPGHLGRPSPLIEVAFETARTMTDMMYRKLFQRYRGITWIVSHCGGGKLATIQRR